MGIILQQHARYTTTSLYRTGMEVKANTSMQKFYQRTFRKPKRQQQDKKKVTKRELNSAAMSYTGTVQKPGEMRGLFSLTSAGSLTEPT